MSGKMQAIEPAEREKMMRLKSESKDASLNSKVEWLYSGDKIDRDAYLLGKPIDKMLIEKELEKPKESAFAKTVDLAAKIREDPLFEIKKQEIEAKKRLLENPFKIKQIKEMISQSRGDGSNSDSDSDSSSRRKKHKHKKSSKKAHKNRGSDTDSDREAKSRKKKRSRSRSRTRSRDRSRETRRKSRSRSDSRGRRNHRSRSRSAERHEASSNYGLVKSGRSGNERESHKDKPKSQTQIEIEEYKKRIEKIKQIRASDGPKQTYNKNVSSKLSEEEKQRRLAEMQDNAKWRNDVRAKNVSKYKSDEKKEEQLQEDNNMRHRQAEASAHFNNIMRDAYVSAEDRIKRNINNIQRNQSSFDRNFARK